MAIEVHRLLGLFLSDKSGNDQRVAAAVNIIQPDVNGGFSVGNGSGFSGSFFYDSAVCVHDPECGDSEIFNIFIGDHLGVCKGCQSGQPVTIYGDSHPDFIGGLFVGGAQDSTLPIFNVTEVSL